MRAQLQSQAFFYVFALFVASLLLVFGYRALSGVGDVAEETRLAEFREVLRADVSAVASQPGMVRRFSYALPASVSEVCFAAPSTERLPDGSCTNLSGYPLIVDALNGTRENVFLLGSRFEAFRIDAIDTKACLLRCFATVSGNVEFSLAGSGVSASVFRS